MNNYKTNYVRTLIIMLFLIILLCIFFYFGRLFFDNNNNNKVYDIHLPIKGNGLNKNLCPTGCIRGSCDVKNKKSKCHYNYECNYCQDPKTNMFYVNYTNEETIIPLVKQKGYNDELNNIIRKNNIYINELDERIKILNSKNMV